MKVWNTHYRRQKERKLFLAYVQHSDSVFAVVGAVVFVRVFIDSRECARMSTQCYVYVMPLLVFLLLDTEAMKRGSLTVVFFIFIDNKRSKKIPQFLNKAVSKKYYY